MFAYEDGNFSMCGEVECCALDSGIVQFAVTAKSSCASCDGHCDESDCGMQGEFGDSCL